jgi:type II secretory ATPase GspE/PulE/Tfp pilus assembly ATPase PilB-like protein
MNGEPTFTQHLRSVTSKIHASTDVDGILLDVSGDICVAFGADRITIYLANEDKSLIVSKVKAGLDAVEELKLPVSPEYSVAGYVALYKKLVNIRDAYDDEELRSFDPPVYFLKDIDQFTGYRTKQMLVAPILDGADSRDLIGVVQLINSRSGHPFPKIAEMGMVRLCKTLATAFRQKDRNLRAVRSKYDYLVIDGVLSAAELDLAIRSARRKGLDIEQVLTSEFQVTDAALGEALSKFYGLPYEPFRADRPRPAGLLKMLKPKFVESQAWVPVEENESGLVVVTTDPERVRRSRIVNQIFSKQNVSYRICSDREFAATIKQFYGSEDSTGSVDSLISSMEADSGDRLTEVSDAVEPDNSTVQLVNRVIASAHDMRASDIHIEPRSGAAKTKIRFRIDGSLRNYIEVPSSHHAKLVARLKIMANLDISNRREPQDGKIKLSQFYAPLDIELRIATIPTAGGKEDVVLRLSGGGKPVPLGELGLSPRNLETLKPLVIKPYGLFLVCGPTGSGKTTTLHSIMDHINTPETKIWTAEDPVEITQEGMRQVQINPKSNMSFARAMRAFLRADPDVIMVGEMRDKETTSIGIEASLTGHRVFATLHTNSAPESIVRLLDMGMDPFNFADALLGILAQRLAKRLCNKCKKPHVATPQEMASLLEEYCEELKNIDAFRTDVKAARTAILADWKKKFAFGEGQFLLYEAEGCEECQRSGYRGRVGLHELLAATDTIKKHIQEHARVADILATALGEGMRTLRQDGIEKVLQGITDMRQVRAVCMK